MLYSDIASINVGVASYSGTDLDSNLKSVKQYEDIILQNVKPNQHSKELIDSFLYFYFIETQTKWPLAKKFNYDERFSVDDINDKSLERLTGLIEKIKTSD